MDLYMCQGVTVASIREDIQRFVGLLFIKSTPDLFLNPQCCSQCPNTIMYYGGSCFFGIPSEIIELHWRTKQALILALQHASGSYICMLVLMMELNVCIWQGVTVASIHWTYIDLWDYCSSSLVNVHQIHFWILNAVANAQMLCNVLWRVLQDLFRTSISKLR